MKFSSLQENLAEGLQIVSRAVPTKGSLPILSNVYISTESGRIKLAATDLATTIMTYVGASIDKKGEATVPAKLLKDFISNLSPGTVDILLEDDTFHVHATKSKSKFNSTHAEDFPELPEPSITNHILELDTKPFHEAISAVAFSSGNDTGRPILTGTLVKSENGEITIAATDGYRLSEKILKVNTDQQDFTAVIPTKTLTEVSRIFSKEENPIKFTLSEDDNQVIFLSGDTYVSTRIIDGQYPPYKQIIPPDTSIKASFSTEEFIEAVKLTSVFASSGDSGNAVKLILDPTKQHIKITSLSEEMGEHESTIPANVEGEPTEIAFNVKYLLDFLNNIKGSEIYLETNGSISPCIFRTKEHENYRHIIMPLQI
ncbi:DNA polymerase III subunit beta [Patescibacteria group bacterium]|nr:DNA polymerase III subunit beta [Patescibacteria group bacterium]